MSPHIELINKIYSYLRVGLFKLDPELIHDLLVLGLRTGIKIPHFCALNSQIFAKTYPELTTTVFNEHFANPIGLAAGFDKNAHLLPFISSLGFGFSEIGSITNLPSKGNPRPRLYRDIKAQAIINRMGLNNDGITAILERIKEPKANFPVGINVAKTHSPEIIGDLAIADILASLAQLKNLPKKNASYLALNISCPNTQEGKTFEEPEILSELLLEVRKLHLQFPILLKLSLDLSPQQLTKIVSLCLDYNLQGLIIGNTKKVTTPFIGGLSGPALYERAKEFIALSHKISEGKITLIGVGGISTGRDAYEMIKAGASLVQLYTSMIYHGPAIARTISEELVSLLRENRCLNISTVRGVSKL